MRTMATHNPLLNKFWTEKLTKTVIRGRVGYPALQLNDAKQYELQYDFGWLLSKGFTYKNDTQRIDAVTTSQWDVKRVGPKC